jgi:hypothetical protein
MSDRVTYTLIVLFLLALSGHMVHTVMVHEEGVCEICLHTQSNDDSDVSAEPHETQLWETTLLSKTIIGQIDFDQTVLGELNTRGPPSFSAVS